MKEVLLESFTFEGMEDGKPIPWMEEKFQTAVNEAKTFSELVEALRQTKLVDAWDVLEIVLKRMICK